MIDSEGMAMFPTKILLATDGSEEARLAARVAVSVANGTGSELHAVHAAIPEMAAAAHPYATLPAETFEELEERSRDFLNEQARATEELGGTLAGTHPTTGGPAEAIVRVGEEIGAGLIVVGSRGLGRMRRLVLGSVSESVARHAPCPVLVVRAEGVDAFPGKILLATDGSPEGKRAAKAAMELADKLGSELHIAYVEPLSASMPAPGGVAGGAGASVLEELERRGRRTLDEQVREIEEQGGTVAGGHLRIGRPDEEIVELGEGLGAGAVVLGSRGLGTLKRAVMGSVSESVVRHAFSPVLVVREGRGR